MIGHRLEAEMAAKAAPESIRTSIGNVSAIFALEGWLLLDAAGRTSQIQCFRQRDLAAGLVATGLPNDEAEKVAHALWRQRPGDASMSTNSLSVVRSIGGQWLSGVIILLVIVLFVVAYAGWHTMLGH
jgi:hypothetical protein